MTRSAHVILQLEDDPDLPLVQETRSGNIAAFEELVKRYDRRLLRLAHNIVHNHEDAQEVVQDAFITAFTKLELFKGKSRFSTWLIRIVVNRALTKARGSRRAFVSLDDTSDENENRGRLEIADWAPDPEMAYSNSELRTILDRSLRKLGRAQRAVFILRDIEGLSIEEVAQALDLTHSAVKIRTMRARLRLRNELSRYFKRRGRRSKEVAGGFTTIPRYDASLAQLGSG